MSFIPPEFLPYIKYGTPPVLGAVIGYVTNRVAIRMLFRPLKAWRFLGIRVPMTPGVIPSKRDELAHNLGEVVGDHLLTSTEINKGLKKELFQKQLLHLIEGRINGVLERDLPDLPTLIPSKFLVYFDLARKTATYQVKESIHSFITSENFTAIAETTLDNRIDEFLDYEMGSVLTSSNRKSLYLFIEKNIGRMFESPEMEQWVDDFVHQKVHSVLKQEKTVAEVVPESVQELLLASLEKQTPALLSKLATIVNEPDVRDNIVKGACGGVDNFIDSLGSMADMVRGFLKMETVEEKIREYLVEKNDDIVAWLQSEKVHSKVIETIRERSTDFLNRPIASYIRTEDEDVVEDFCAECTRQIMLLMRDKDVSCTISNMIQSNIENYIDSGNITINESLEELVGKEGMKEGKGWIKRELLSLIRSEKTLSTIDSMVDSMIATLLNRRIGRLANIIPAGVREGMARSMQKITSAMLETEVPGLVRSLNIRQIVVEKVNSLDILRLEGLLLSIMEEQFKYINLFGALLGCIIGCLNLLFLYGI